jgi:hypothetical protein
MRDAAIGKTKKPPLAVSASYMQMLPAAILNLLTGIFTALKKFELEITNPDRITVFGTDLT